MPSLPSEWLREIGLAEFDRSAAADVGAYAAQFARSRGVEFFQAFTEFGAAEYALAPLYHSGLSAGGQFILGATSQAYPTFPVHVSDSDVSSAIFKTNCGPFDEHARKAPGQLRFWDVFAFAGDMSKIELMGFGDDVNALADPDRMEALIEALAERYQRAGVGDRVVESGLLAAQGLVWFAKLALLRGEDYTAAPSQRFVSRFSRRYEVS